MKIQANINFYMEFHLKVEIVSSYKYAGTILSEQLTGHLGIDILVVLVTGDSPAHPTYSTCTIYYHCTA